MNVKFSAFGIVLLLLLLSGCMDAGGVKKQGQPASGEYLVVVQNAVDEFQKRTGVLPIKNKDLDVPVYEKYPIDFQKLQGKGLLSTIPANSFEKGGSAIYILMDAETKPTVKLMDLVSYQQVGAVQKDINDYMTKHNGSIPKGEQLAPGIYRLDTNLLGKKTPTIVSPYSRGSLTIVMDEQGKAALDYGPEIAKAMSMKKMTSADPAVDLRTLLTEASYFVPVKSYPYYWKNGQPIISTGVNP